MENTLYTTDEKNKKTPQDLAGKFFNDNVLYIPLPPLEYPSQDIAPSLSSERTPSPRPEDVTQNDIDAFVIVVNKYISSIKKQTFTVNTHIFGNNMNSILSAIATSSNPEVVNHASGEMKKIICKIERSMLDHLIINNSTFRKLISEINDASLLRYFLDTGHLHKIDAVQMLTAFASLLKIYESQVQKPTLIEDNIYVREFVQGHDQVLPQFWLIIIQAVANLESIIENNELVIEHHQQISLSIQSIYQLVTQKIFHHNYLRPGAFFKGVPAVDP